MSTDNRKVRDAKKQPQAEIPAHLTDLHCFTETNGVITTTMFDVPGYKVLKVLGTVYGITVRSRNWAAGFTMVMKSVEGGELRWFTSMVGEITRVWLMCANIDGNIALRSEKRCHREGCSRDTE